MTKGWERSTGVDVYCMICKTVLLRRPGIRSERHKCRIVYYSKGREVLEGKFTKFRHEVGKKSVEESLGTF